VVWFGVTGVRYSSCLALSLRRWCILKDGWQWSCISLSLALPVGSLSNTERERRRTVRLVYYAYMLSCRWRCKCISEEWAMYVYASNGNLKFNLVLPWFQ
jgi:hypothetical protein